MVNDKNKAKAYSNAEWQQSAESRRRYNVNSSRAKQFLAFMALKKCWKKKTQMQMSVELLTVNITYRRHFASKCLQIFLAFSLTLCVMYDIITYYIIITNCRCN